MADVIQKIQFKRGTNENLTLVLKGESKLAQGEPAYELDTNKIKVGDGINDYENLPYLGGEAASSLYIEGYYLAGKFYTDSTYTEECTLSNKAIYINKNTKSQTQAENFIQLYRYCGSTTGFLPLISMADDVTPGLVKLYKEHGVNEDGTMTQKAITEGVQGIKFSVETTDTNGDGKVDENDENCLVLEIPWLN